jgi:hypothetical protein
MGDLPRKNDVFLFFCFSKKMISLLRVTYPKIECDLPGKRLGWNVTYLAKDLVGAVLTGQG